MPNENPKTDWEKVSIYIAVTVTLLTALIYIADMKERIAKLEIKNEFLAKELEYLKPK